MFEYTARIIATACLTLLLALPTAVSAEIDSDFDHATTGFPLTGGHRKVECENCHRSGIFAGTPRQCVICHTQQEFASGAVKPANHIPSSNECEACHDTRSWTLSRKMDHAAVLGSCSSCHNGIRAEGTPVNHVPVNNWECIDCHRTSAWQPARFRHLNVPPGQCTNCHNGVTATGRPTNGVHSTTLGATESCDSCHTTRGWVPAHFNHTGVAPGTCTTCHNGTISTGKPSDQIHNSTTASCDTCHSTRAWSPASYDHSQATYYPNHTFRRLACTDCHSGGNYTIAWTYAPPDCITCHDSDFRREHSASKAASYHNCTVGCHEHSSALSRGKW